MRNEKYYITMPQVPFQLLHSPCPQNKATNGKIKELKKIQKATS